MKAGKILLPFIIVIAATIFFSVFVVKEVNQAIVLQFGDPCLLYTSPSPRDRTRSRMPSSA